MSDANTVKLLHDVINQFDFDGNLISVMAYGNGHINLTYLVTFEADGIEKNNYILQRFNKSIFTKPLQVMENILAVTNHLRKKIEKNGGDPKRETMTVIPTRDGKSCFVDEQGEYWRSFLFIEDAVSLELVEKPEEFYECGVAFGRFQYLLSDFPADTLHEIIPGFHDTSRRFDIFVKAVEDNICNRAAFVQQEIDFILKRKDMSKVLGEMRNQKKIPLRVTHNDTKLNNIMMDKKTGKGICIIDLDTVMPGLSLYDFGDSIRTGASTGSEDEVDLSKVWCDLNLFHLYTKGFISGCGGTLTKEELKALPLGAKVMTFESGIRFLTDYLSGDTYFRIHREHHNLDRCRTQIKLVSDMEQKWDEINQIIEGYID